jgi:hypothetical protein
MALCLLFDGGTLVTIGINGATASLVVITLDRYVKIVHPITHRKRYRRWMLYAGLFLPWLNGVASYLLPAIGTSGIVHGVCYVAAFWPLKYMMEVHHPFVSFICVLYMFYFVPLHLRTLAALYKCIIIIIIIVIIKITKSYVTSF